MLRIVESMAMQSGCVIAIITGALAILVVSVVFRIFVWPDRQRRGTSAMIHVIEKAMLEYQKDFSALPAGGNGQVAALLLGDNTREKSYLNSDSVVLRDGLFADFWKRPLRFGTDVDGAPRVISAGPNGRFGDEDDIDSGLIREMIRIDVEKRAPGAPATNP